MDLGAATPGLPLRDPVRRSAGCPLGAPRVPSRCCPSPSLCWSTPQTASPLAPGWAHQRGSCAETEALSEAQNWCPAEPGCTQAHRQRGPALSHPGLTVSFGVRVGKSSHGLVEAGWGWSRASGEGPGQGVGGAGEECPDGDLVPVDQLSRACPAKHRPTEPFRPETLCFSELGGP